MGIYAPDRFQSSFTGGFRYEHHFDQRFSLGAGIGYARAEQGYFQQIGIPLPEQGTATVLHYDGHFSYAFPVGTVIPYGNVGLGVTRQHSEANLTLTFGIGTRVPLGQKTYLRYEMNDHIFTSGKDNTSWTNHNLEFTLGISFFLQ
jgi:outer membrane beta-barrel protein